MKHLKLFKTAQDKETWKNSDNYITPNVIYVNESDVIEFNPNTQLLSLHAFTAYPEVANKIMTIVNKYCSNYENVSFMSIIVDMNFNYEGINYVPGYAYITLSNPEDVTYENVECKLSTEDLNYLQSISIVDTVDNVYKPHDVHIDFFNTNITFNIYENNTGSVNIIKEFYMELDYVDKDLNTLVGYLVDPDDDDPNAAKPA